MTINDAVVAARNVGLSGDALVTAVAIAGAESGWRLNAYGDVDIGGSWGPWQIYIPAHPQYSPEWLTASWANNASAMYEISGGGGNWGPWSTYNNDAYLTYMADAQSAVGDAGGSLTVEPNEQASSQLSGVLQFVSAQLGKPYRYGGNGPDAWDCSGLIMAAFASVGVDLPRTADLQHEVGMEIDPTQIQPGDLIFMHGDGVDFGHVGIAMSSSTWINAPRTGDYVNEGPIPFERIQSVKRVVSGGGVGSGTNKLTGWNIPNPFAPQLALADAASWFVKAAAWFGDPDNWLRVLQVFGGAMLMLTGLLVMARPGVEGKIGSVGKLAAKAVAV